jgi:putative holliday junction resolvase
MILGIDYGSHRIGIAAADYETRFARPLEVIDVRVVDAAQRIAQLVDELGVTLVVVGRPLGLSGTAGPAVESQAHFVNELRERIDVRVIEHDERLTTVVAEQGMRAARAGKAARRKERDAVAAQLILQGYLDSEPRQ